MSDRDITVPKIVERCGGASVLAPECGLTVWAIYKWAKIGIPEERWSVIMALSGVTVEEIYQANRLARLVAA